MLMFGDPAIYIRFDRTSYVEHLVTYLEGTLKTGCVVLPPAYQDVRTPRQPLDQVLRNLLGRRAQLVQHVRHRIWQGLHRSQDALMFGGCGCEWGVRCVIFHLKTFLYFSAGKV